jgi:hypothetical protein
MGRRPPRVIRGLVKFMLLNHLVLILWIEGREHTNNVRRFGKVE